MPKAKMSVMTSDRYSLILASSSMGTPFGRASTLEAGEEPPGERQDHVVEQRAAQRTGPALRRGTAGRRCFSCLYRPGATNIQICAAMTGKDTKVPANKATFT